MSIGVGLIAVAVALFAAGGSIKWIAVAPQKWSHLSQVGAQLQAHALQFLALFVLWAGIFAVRHGSRAIAPREFLRRVRTASTSSRCCCTSWDCGTRPHGTAWSRRWSAWYWAC